MSGKTTTKWKVRIPQGQSVNLRDGTVIHNIDDKSVSISVEMKIQSQGTKENSNVKKPA